MRKDEEVEYMVMDDTVDIGKEPLPQDESDKVILEKLKREKSNYLRSNAQEKSTAKH